MTTTSYSVSAQSVVGGEASVDVFGKRIAFDASDGRDLVRPGPSELLCGALAACLLKNVERFSHILKFQYTAARATVEAVREDSPPRFVRFSYRVEVVTNEPEARLELLHKNVRKFGTVSATLAGAAEVEGSLVAVGA